MYTEYSILYTIEEFSVVYVNYIVTFEPKKKYKVQCLLFKNIITITKISVISLYCHVGIGHGFFEYDSYQRKYKQ